MYIVTTDAGSDRYPGDPDVFNQPETYGWKVETFCNHDRRIFNPDEAYIIKLLNKLIDLIINNPLIAEKFLTILKQFINTLKGLEWVGGKLQVAIKTALGFEPDGKISWLYDPLKGLGVDSENKAFVKLADKKGLGFAPDGSITAMVDNETIIIEDGKLKAVQKDPFDDLEICDDIDLGTPTPDFWATCHTVPALAGGCSIKKLGASTDASGCTKIGWYSDSSIELVSGGSEAVPAGTVERWPLDPTDHALYYDYPTLHDDNVALSIDTAKLNRTKLACFAVDVPCDNMALQLDIGATVTFDPDNQGISRFVVSIDGVFPRNAAGETIAMAYFTSFEGTTNPTLPLSLSTGQHTLCLYVVGGSTTKNMAQITVQNTVGAKRPVYSVSRKIA